MHAASNTASRHDGHRAQIARTIVLRSGTIEIETSGQCAARAIDRVGFAAHGATCWFASREISRVMCRIATCLVRTKARRLRGS